MSAHNIGRDGLPRVTLVNGRVAVDFTEFDKWMHYCLDELGMRWFRAPWLQIGGHSALVSLGETGLRANSPGYADAMRQYLRILRAKGKTLWWYNGGGSLGQEPL